MSRTTPRTESVWYRARIRFAVVTSEDSLHSIDPAHQASEDVYQNRSTLFIRKLISLIQLQDAIVSALAYERSPPRSLRREPQNIVPASDQPQEVADR